jgi:hypothetical protein
MPPVTKLEIPAACAKAIVDATVVAVDWEGASKNY